MRRRVDAPGHGVGDGTQILRPLPVLRQQKIPQSDLRLSGDAAAVVAQKQRVAQRCGRPFGGADPRPER
jgi:hypothetical protein